MAGKTWNDNPPPNYVTLLQLKEIWMKKQEEKKLREKEEEERRKQEEEERRKQEEEEERRKQEEERRKQEEERRKQEAERGNGGRGRIGHGRVRIVVDEKGNGTEIILEGNENRWSDGDFRRGESVGYERNRNGMEREKFVRGGIPEGKRMDFRGGFRRNGRIRLDQLKKNEGGSDFGGGMLGDGGYNEERGERGRNNGGFLNRYSGLKESRDVVLKGKEVEPETVKKGEDENGGPYGRSRLDQLKQNEGGSDFGGGMLGDRGYNEERRDRGRNNGGFQNRYNGLKESRDVVLKWKEVEPETVKKGEDENVGPYGRSRNVRGDRVNQLKQNEGGSDFGGGMLGDRGYNEERGDRGRNNGGFQNRYNGLKESGDVVLKWREVEPEMVKEGEVLGERSGLRGRGRNGFKGRNKRIEDENLREGDRNGEEKRKANNEVKVEGEGLSDYRVGVESKLGDGGLTMESMKNDEKEGVGEGYRRDRNWRRSKRRFNRFKESRDDVIGNKLEIETERKAEGEILEAFNEKCGLSEGDRNDDEKRIGTNEVKVEQEGSSDDRMALKSVKNGKKEGVGKGYRRFGDWKGKAKAKGEVFNEKRRLSEGDGNDDGKRNEVKDARAEGGGLSDEVLMVESVKNGEKEGVGKGYGRHGNGYNKFGNEKGNFAERFGNRRGSFGRQRINQGGSGMMWVKKEEESGAAAAAAGSSGVQNIKSNRIPTNRAFWNDRVY
ncbi:hypothetical protein ACS0TY_025900 [Phlomoides rotata]